MAQHSSSPQARLKPTWPTCDYRDINTELCIGVRVNGHDRCLAHLEPIQQDGVLSHMEPGSDVDLQGVTVSEALLERLFEAVGGSVVRDAHDARQGKKGPVFGHAQFNLATFPGTAVFRWATFSQAEFTEATFGGDATFGGAKFGDAEFSGVTFSGNAGFVDAEFASWASFKRTTFGGNADFGRVTFSGPDADFDGAMFEVAEQFGPVTASKLTLRRAVFARHVVIEAVALGLWGHEARFEQGATLRLGHVNFAYFTRAMFGAPSTLTAIAGPDALPLPAQTSNARDAEDKRTKLLSELRRRPKTPRLVSLEGVDTADLVLTDINLSACRFSGAHHLDKLRFEGDCTFTGPPARLRHGRAWLPVWRWTRRQVLAEESLWRETTRKAAGWATESIGGAESAPLQPKRLADLYRQIRKAQEDSKNEPGAADFYYGEMEMRRKDRSSTRSERLILLLYWLSSGYGLRAIRAVTCLIILIMVAAVVLQVAGYAGPVFNPHPDLGNSVLYSAQFTLSLDKSTMPQLTATGEVIRLFMRLLGPLLLGLTLLAVRNRVKR